MVTQALGDRALSWVVRGGDGPAPDPAAAAVGGSGAPAESTR